MLSGTNARRYFVLFRRLSSARSNKSKKCNLLLIIVKKNLAVYSDFYRRHPPTRRSKTANITEDDITLQHIATMSLWPMFVP